MSAPRSILLLLCASGFVLSGCAREPDPVPVTITPIYDKYGAPSCPAGTILVSDDSGADFCQ